MVFYYTFAVSNILFILYILFKQWKILSKNFDSNRTTVENDNFDTIVTYSVDELVERLRANQKVDYVKVCLKESFSDEDEINYLWLVVKSHFKHMEFVKSLKISIIDEYFYEVRIQLKKNPSETLIKDIYKNCVVEGKEWGTGNTATDNVCFSLKVDAETLFKLVNWKYSMVNK